MSAVLDLFADASRDEMTSEQLHVVGDPVERAVASVARVLRRGASPVLAYSSGKDSTVTAVVTFIAAVQLKRETGVCPPLYLVNADTRVESPVVRSIADVEIGRMEAFARRHGLSFHPHVVPPSLARSFAARIIGGRALPSFPGVNGSCSIEWKITSTTRAIREIRKRERDVVLFIGTRSGESALRAINTAARGESAHTTWFGPEGDERLSPVLDWTTDDVWETIGRAAAGEFETYSEFSEVVTFYKDAGASSCVVVADMRSAGNNKPCGSRGGCWSCLRVANDHSAENMVQSDPETYAYLKPLLRLRAFMAATQNDWSLRNFVGRTIHDGWVSIKADQYNPEMCKRLLRYTLWAQQESNRLGAPSLVQPIGVRDLIAIDAAWSSRGMWPPFEALRVWKEHEAGHVAIPPVITQKFPPTQAPDIGKIFVGDAWDKPGSPDRPEGLRHAVWEMFSDSCGPSLRVGTDGDLFLDLEEESEFEVDEEGASLFLEFEADRKIREYADGYVGDWTAGAMNYVAYGCLSLAKGQSGSFHSMLRRASWLQRHDLHGQRSADELRARCDVLHAQQSPLF